MPIEEIDAENYLVQHDDNLSSEFIQEEHVDAQNLNVDVSDQLELGQVFSKSRPSLWFL